jgi:hypothetical protein
MTTHVANKKIKLASYDFFAEEWSGNCGACYKDFYAPTKGAYTVQRQMHTHSDECLGGW